MEIDKNSRIPAYVQLMSSLITQMEDGTLPEEEKLPSERELCDIYAVSRTTVRQAIHELEKDGYVYIYKGRGTYVAAKRLNQEMSGLYSFTESMKQLGKTISTRLIDFAQIKCDERIARKMQCAVGTEIFRFTRVRYADNEPVLIVTTHLPCKRFPNFDAERLHTDSLYSMMTDTYNVTFSKAKETLQSVCARGDEGVLLQVESGAPCMKIDRYTFEKDTLVEYAVGIARGDKFAYNVELC
ncbi:MAG: GntR family transcriptional regulator [Oscillospiraceae bacterium]|nr:GntR family transcriptional regulator [Oscillospiraceae bacterium]